MSSMCSDSSSRGWRRATYLASASTTGSSASLDKDSRWHHENSSSSTLDQSTEGSRSIAMSSMDHNPSSSIRSPMVSPYVWLSSTSSLGDHPSERRGPKRWVDDR